MKPSIRALSSSRIRMQAAKETAEKLGTTEKPGNSSENPEINQKLSENPSTPLYLNPHAWQGLPADRVFQLHQLNKQQDGYFPSDQERHAVLSTFASLSGKNAPKLEYVYEIDNFKERFMNNDFNRKPIPKRSNVDVRGKGSTPHEQRKIDQFHRICAFEMPLLAKYRQPYTGYDKSASPLQFTFYTDFSDDVSAKENRVVSLRVNVADLSLDEGQRKKFIILADRHFDHRNQAFVMKCLRYNVATQNARWLCESFNRLLSESRDLLKESFADIPIDTRGARVRSTPQFPEEWKRPQDAPVRRNNVSQATVARVLQARDDRFARDLTPVNTKTP